MKKKTLLTVLAALVMTVSCFFALASCDDGKKSDGSGSGGGPVVEVDPEVEALEVTTAPTKTNYIPGQAFDVAGMVLTAKWNDDIDEELAKGEYTIVPTVFAEGDTKVTFTYEGVSLEYPITVKNWEDITVHSLNVDRKALAKKTSAGYFDFASALKVSAFYEETDTKAEKVTDYKLYDNSVEVTDKDFHFLTQGVHNLQVSYGKKTQDFTIDCVYTRIEAETNNLQEGYVAGSKNVAVITDKDGNSTISKVVNGNPVTEFVVTKGTVGDWGISETGIDVCSGGTGYTAINNGDKFEFHLYSTEAKTVALKVGGMSNKVQKRNKEWGADVTADVKFNEAFTLNVNGTNVTVADSVVYEGKTRNTSVSNSSYSILYWTQEKTVANIDLKAGDNVITLTACGGNYEITEGVNLGSTDTWMGLDYIQIGNEPAAPYTLSTMQIVAGEGGKPTLKLTGTVEEGYTAEDFELSEKEQCGSWKQYPLLFNMEITGTDYVVTADLSGISTCGEVVCKHTFFFNTKDGKDVEIKTATVGTPTGQVVYGGRQYVAGEVYGTPCVQICSYTVDSATIVTGADNKPTLKLTGEIYGKTAADFSLGAMKNFGDWAIIELDFNMDIVGQTYTLTADLSSLLLPADKTSTMYEFKFNEGPDATKTLKAAITGRVEYGVAEYASHDNNGVACMYVNPIPMFTVDAATISAGTGGKPTLTFTGTVKEGHTTADFALGAWLHHGAWTTENLDFDMQITGTTYTATADVSGITLSAAQTTRAVFRFYLKSDLVAAEDIEKMDMKCPGSITGEVVYNDFTYTASDYWGAESVVITRPTTSTPEPTTGYTVTSITLTSGAGGKPILTLTGKAYDYAPEDFAFGLTNYKNWQTQKVASDIVIVNNNLTVTVDLSTITTENTYQLKLTEVSTGETNGVWWNSGTLDVEFAGSVTYNGYVYEHTVDQWNGVGRLKISPVA